MPSDIVLNVIMQSVNILNVVMLNVTASLKLFTHMLELYSKTFLMLLFHMGAFTKHLKIIIQSLLWLASLESHYPFHGKASLSEARECF